MRNIYTSIDIGTDTIKVVVCELFNNKINLLASSSNKSKGIKNGVITDVDEASISLKGAIEEVETKLGFKITKVLTIIPSMDTKFTLINGSVNVVDTITDKDIVRVLQKGMVENGSFEMVTILPIGFKIDGVTNTMEPLGKKARLLESKAILVETPPKNIYNVMKLMNKCNLEIVDISISGICDMCALKNREIESGVGAIINMGSETTTISLYNKGIIVRNKVIEVGGKAIDNDISYVYKTSMLEAKKIKEKFAIATSKQASPSDIYDVISENGNMIKVSQQEVSSVLEARLDEILRVTRKEMYDLASKELNYVIFTGGVSNTAYFEYKINEIFGSIAKIAKINIIGLRNDKFTTCLGNIVYYINKQKLIGKIESMVENEIIENLSSIKKNTLSISNESMLGKVASYFFGE